MNQKLTHLPHRLIAAAALSKNRLVNKFAKITLMEISPSRRDEVLAVVAGQVGRANQLEESGLTSISQQLFTEVRLAKGKALKEAGIGTLDLGASYLPECLYIEKISPIENLPQWYEPMLPLQRQALVSIANEIYKQDFAAYAQSVQTIKYFLPGKEYSFLLKVDNKLPYSYNREHMLQFISDLLSVDNRILQK